MELIIISNLGQLCLKIDSYRLLKRNIVQIYYTIIDSFNIFL
jgi:hypothetical protein